MVFRQQALQKSWFGFRDFQFESCEMREIRPASPASAEDTGAPQSIARLQVFLVPSNNNSLGLLAPILSDRCNSPVAAGGPTVQGTAIQRGISNRNQSVANPPAGLLASRFDTTASHRVSARSLHPSPAPHTAAQAQDVRRR